MTSRSQTEPIILASKSGSRQAMLTAAGVAFDPVPAHLDERELELSLGDSAADKIALRLAEAKAQAVSTDYPGRIVLGSDSLVTVAGKRFDKPASRDQAEEHLRFFSGKEMQLHSAAALALDGALFWGHCALARLQMRPLTEGFIKSYLDAEWPEVSHCVGVFRIEAMGVQLFDRIDGDQFTVLGMPLLPVLGALRDCRKLPQ